MNPPQAISMLFFSIFFFFLDYVSAQSPPPPPLLYTTNDLFQPSLAIITGVFSIVFTLTFVLLIYAKCLHNDLRSETYEDGDIGRLERLWQGLFSQSSRISSGLDKTAIESLPFFRFSALKGSKQGLECSVCLSKFEDVEILRLLPKCKHAFHIECIDEWLEQHATCPLCRNRVSIEDELSVLGSSSNSLRIMSQLTETREDDSTMEVYIEREEEVKDDSSRLSSFRKILKFGKNDNSLSLVEQGNEKHMHKFNHKIVVSDVVFKSRWSNVTLSDLTFLTSNMLSSTSSDRFSSIDRVQRGNLRDKEEIDMKKMVNNKDSTRRVVSEITAVPRYSVLQVTTSTRESAVGGSNSVLAASTASTSRGDVIAEMEERRRRLWLPIARKTAQWFVNREKRNELKATGQDLKV